MMLSPLNIHGINGLRTTLVFFMQRTGESIAQSQSVRLEEEHEIWRSVVQVPVGVRLFSGK